MTSESRHLSESIDRAAEEVYDYACDPANMPEWAPGLGSSIEQVDGRWFVDTPAGRVGVTFTPRNSYGVLDHDVTLPSGEVIHVPLRVIADGKGCEVVFTLRRLPGMSDQDVERDANAVTADLARLKRILETRAAPHERRQVELHEKATRRAGKWPVSWSGWGDLNSRPLRPERSALPSCATPRRAEPQRCRANLGQSSGKKDPLGHA
jgi:hypothetical protein